MEKNEPINLTRTAYVGRQTIKFSIIFLVVLIVGRTFWSAFSAYWTATHPPAPPPPTVGFDRLPPLRFPIKTDKEKPSSYQLEMANGRLPLFPDRAKVFLMPRPAPSLLADQRAKQIAANYGYVFAPTILNARTYRWSKSAPLQATLEMDILNNNFSIQTNYLTKPELLVQKNLPDDPRATQLVRSAVAAGQELPVDIATPSGQITYLKSLGRDTGPAVSFSDADFEQVDINRAALDNRWPFYTPGGTIGVIHGIVTGSLSGRDGVVELQYRYHPMDYKQVQTYPLRTAQQAWQMLQAGEGYVAQKGQFETAVVRDIVLGYYDDFEEQEYMQPIYIFLGDGGFMGYVPAVDPKWIQQKAAL